MNALLALGGSLCRTKGNVFPIQRRSYCHSRGIHLEKRILHAKEPDRLEKIYEEHRDHYEERHWKVTFTALEKLSIRANDHAQLLHIEKKWRPRLIEALQGDPSAEFISAVAWNYAKWGIGTPNVMRQCYAQAMVKGTRRFSTNALSQLAWSKLAVGCAPEQEMQEIGGGIGEKIKEKGSIVIEEALRFHAFALSGRILWGDSLLSRDVENCIAKALKQCAAVATTPSHFQEEVAAVVRRLLPANLAMQEEFFFEGYFLDIAIPEKQIAIEVDGPRHFYPGTKEWIAKDKVKDWILTGLGWSVVRIPYWEWNAVCSREDRDRLIGEKLSGLI